MKDELKRYLFDISNAVNRILRTEPEIEITNAKRIVQTRNFIIHNYDKVDETIIWGIITNDLLKLKTEIEILLSEA